MPITGFWLIRHAMVDENARAILYGTLDVALCESTMVRQEPHYRDLAARLPREAAWLVSPLSRTAHTAEAIFAAGYPRVTPAVEPDLREQSLGDWQGLPHARLPPLLTEPPHPFWPLSGSERPPGGESVRDVIARVGHCLDQLVQRWAGKQIVAVSHGGAIRAAVAHALRIDADNALHLSVHNLSLTRLEHQSDGWRVVCVNELGAVS